VIVGQAGERDLARREPDRLTDRGALRGGCPGPLNVCVITPDDAFKERAASLRTHCETVCLHSPSVGFGGLPAGV